MDYASHLLCSELRVQTLHANHVDDPQASLAAPNLSERGCATLSYALAKELDDLDRCDEAFVWFSAAARARRRQLSYDVKLDERKLQRIAAVFSAEYLGAPAAAMGSSARYIFIVGLPRSGTTLLERTLSALPGVRSNGETENFSSALLQATSPGNTDVFERAARTEPVEVATTYAAKAGIAVDGEAIIEKMPMNYLYLAAIHRALPQAKLLWMRRPALESCFGMYRTQFAAAYPFSYDFDDLARYYAVARYPYRRGSPATLERTAFRVS
jgi:hypothetical protein